MTTGLNTEELNALIEVSKTINAHLDLDTVLESVMSVASDVMKVEAASLVLIDDETGDLLFHVARGEQAEDVKPLRMKPGEGIVGRVVQTGRPSIVNDVEQDASFAKRVDDESGFHTRSILCVPLVTRERLWGAIEVLNKSDGSGFEQRDLRLCEALAAHAAIAIEVAVLHRRILAAERLAAVGQTMAGLAHCIKNVLGCIRGGAYAVDLGVQRQDHQMLGKGWDIVKRNNAFMEELVLDMLTYSKERKPHYELTDINDLIDTVCRSITHKAEAKGIAVNWRANDQLGTVELDSKGIRRCLLNLVTNAVDACEEVENGQVDVWSEADDGDLFRINISDNGCGIPEENRESLFEVFFSTKGSRGTGLGLPVTMKIVAEHHGTITVDSEVGQGTTFTVTLPTKRP